MPPKFANLKPREVIPALQKGGFFIHEQSGYSHVHLRHRKRLANPGLRPGQRDVTPFSAHSVIQLHKAPSPS
jgi:hypothetical protein